MHDDDDDFDIPGLPRRKRRRRKRSEADENVLISYPPPAAAPPADRSHSDHVGPQRFVAAAPPTTPSDSGARREAHEYFPQPQPTRAPESSQSSAVHNASSAPAYTPVFGTPALEPPASIHESSRPSRDRSRRRANIDDSSVSDISIPGLRTREKRPVSRSRVIAYSIAISLVVSAGVLYAIAHAPTGVRARLGLSAPNDIARSSGSGSGNDNVGATASGSFVVPDLVRVPLANARSIADTLGVRLNVIERQQDAYIPAESVVRHTPVAGMSLRRGDRLDVVVSSGPPGQASLPPASAAAPNAAITSDASVVTGDATDAATDELIAVPRLTGASVHRARATLEQVGLRLGSRRESFDPDRGPWVVLTQSRSAGSRVARGSAVDVVYNQGE